MLNRLLIIVSLAYTMLNASVCIAELRDPTQLPEDFMINRALEDSTQSVADTGPTLQSVMLSDTVRAAIINGEKIHIGEAYQAFTLVALTENSATLQDKTGGQKILKMPHISIKQHKNNTPSTPRMATREN